MVKLTTMEENAVITKKNKKIIGWLPWLILFVYVWISAGFILYFGINGWVQNGDEYKYYNQGSYVVGMQSIRDDYQSHTYIFDQSGSMKTGWISYNGHYYYQDKEEGIYTGDHMVEDSLYHFEDDGVFHGGLYLQDDIAYVRDKYGFCKEGLVSVGDSVYCSDDDGKVVFGWKSIGGSRRYFDKVTGQMLTDGVFFIDQKGYGFDKNGKMITGWHEYEDGDRYFNVTSGQMCTGEKVINRKRYYFEDDGVAYSGYRTVDDKVYYYSADDNALYKGWLQDGEDFYYYDNNGVRADGLCEIEDKKYFFSDEGKMYTGWKGEYFFTNEGFMATGLVEQDGKTFYFQDDGLRWTEAGWKTIEDKRYLFDSNGLVTKTADIVVGGSAKPRTSNTSKTSVKASGAVTAENLDSYLLGIMSQYGSDPQSIFNYCRQFPYKYRDKSDVTTMACRMLNLKSGACWDYAALCYKMLRLAGYNCQIVIGRGAIYSEHNWILIEIAPGVWRHMDPERKGYYIYMLTDAQLESYDGISRSVRYQWNHDAYPAAN